MAFILLIYFIGILIFAVIGLIGVFHAIKYKMPGDSSAKGAYIFIGVSMVVLVISITFMLKADWSQNIEFFKNGASSKVIKTEK